MQISPIYDDSQKREIAKSTKDSNHVTGQPDTSSPSDNISLWSPCSKFSQALFDTIVDGILVCSKSGKIEWCNQAAADLLGYDRLAVIDLNISMLVTSFTLDEQKITDILLPSNHSIEQILAINLRHQTGTYIPVKFTMRKVVEYDHFIVTLHDLRQQQKVQEALRKEHEKLRITIEHAPMGIITYHPNQCLLSANRSFSVITGYETNELFNLTIDQITHPDDRQEIASVLEHALNQKISRASQRCRYVHKYGYTLYVQVVFGFTHDANGQVDLVIAEVEDLTPQFNAEKQAKLHLEQLAHATRLSTLGEIAAGIAHELNQPLTAISLYSQAGKRLFDNNEPEKITDIFDKLTLHSQRAGSIIQHMQSMARQHQSEKKPIYPSNLMSDIAKLAETETRLRDITIKIEIEDDLKTVTIDIVQIQQVALNLLRNGMEAMHAVGCEHGNTITLSNRLTSEGLIEIAIHDTGCGISTIAASNLFTPFSTTKNTGMGLGLSICKPIIQAHGGQIGYRNNASHGATFFFTLPPTNRDMNDK
jgi:two-component system sensor kinase FixL